MDTKLSAVTAAMDAGDWQRAIALAAKFPRLGAHRNAILDAHSAYTNPRFLTQIGRNPEACIEAGKSALVAAYSLDTVEH